MGEAERTRPLRTAVIIGSNRESRAGDAIGRWFAGVAAARGDHEIDLLDLAEWRFPERFPDRPDEAVTAFTERLDRAEGFVIVTPEYNRGYPSALKEAVDYGYDEWQAKPVAFVSYGYHWAGRYAVEQLRPVFTELHAVTLRDGLHLDLLAEDTTGAEALERRRRTAHTLLDQLGWWGLTLREGRAARPYVA
ncbi:NADPH-dependent FMN reductase [Streptomyces otsuchiensis]|uniref:NADPH-dependent FMN reductase n=1 Tax=Streptomyces otsuchiensis TaxID=2681388 RepID=UPI00102F7C1E|nr:NAD(P)H-dependent oxidoreductase [Streptomyces otsuchiensis]